MNIVGIADVSVGYGSPEVPALMHSLCERFGAKGTLIEPDELTRPPFPKRTDLKFELQRMRSDYEDHTPLWHRQYLDSAYKMAQSLNPDILIIFGGTIFGGIGRLRKQPKVLIYHAYELISHLSERDIDAHKAYIDKADIIITPEIERFIVDSSRIDVYPENVLAIYNVADVDFPNAPAHKPHDQRNGRFVWYGTLHRRQAYADYFYSSSLREFEIDIYGRITDPDPQHVEVMLRQAPNIRYFGLTPSEVLNNQRQNNIFSLVWWNPEISPGHYYLAPNRFFTSIQAGLPIICGPHPQCEDLVNRYGCGLVMKDWSLNCLRRTMGEAWEIYKSSDYRTFIENCRHAAEHALNWDAQFERCMIRMAPIFESKLNGKNILRR